MNATYYKKDYFWRKDVLDRIQWEKTLKLFRTKVGIESTEITQVKRRKTIFFIEDLHLDHANTIRYCSRPFSFYDVEEMNKVLVDDWNKEVKDDDMDYFLGTYLLVVALNLLHIILGTLTEILFF